MFESDCPFEIGSFNWLLTDKPGFDILGDLYKSACKCVVTHGMRFLTIKTKATDLNALKLIMPYILERRYLIVLGLISLVIVDFLQLLIPRVIKRVVDDLTTLEIEWQNLALYTVTIVLLGFLIACFRYAWRRCLIGTSRRVEEGLRNQLFSHLQTLSTPYFDKVKTGDLMAHATNDMLHIRMAMGMGMVALTDAMVLGTAALGFMAYINAKLTFFAMLPTPFIIFGARFFSKRMHQLYGKVQGDFSILTETVRERFAGIRIIKAHQLEEQEAKRLAEASQAYINSNLQLARITGSFFPMMLFFSNLSLAAVLYLGGRQTIYATITAGDFVAFISYLGIIAWPMMALGWVTNLIQRGKASLDRLQTIFDTRPEIADSPAAQSIQHVKGGIRFDDVSFSYHQDPNHPQKALEGITLNIAPGQVLGIVGPPGSGKTSLLNLVSRLYDVSNGVIHLDGFDIRSLKVADLRSNVAFVPQEPFLFAGTIRENILLNLHADPAQGLIPAATEACLHETVLAFPKGYDTVVGEKGVILSGGQKQRVALARAFLKDAPILILDDPISQVDTETGSAIIRAIQSKTRQKTVLMASHRLSALKSADIIISMKDNHIVEDGTHEELLAQNGYYAKTYRMQEIEEALNAA
jgi:ATP-binding cassette, subfamily B, multidrug efflux pump